jgi:hypothetical protein
MQWWKMTEDPDINIKEIVEAYKKSEKKAGMVKMSDVGASEEEIKIPVSTGKYVDETKCECNCHPKKEECMECYDHPIHLKKNHTKTA